MCGWVFYLSRIIYGGASGENINNQQAKEQGLWALGIEGTITVVVSTKTKKARTTTTLGKTFRQ